MPPSASGMFRTRRKRIASQTAARTMTTTSTHPASASHDTGAVRRGELVVDRVALTLLDHAQLIDDLGGQFVGLALVGRADREALSVVRPACSMRPV